MKHAALILLCLGLLTGFGLFVGFISALLVIMAQASQSGVGWQWCPGRRAS